MYTIKNDAEVEIRHAQITNAVEARDPFCFRLSGHFPVINKINFNDIYMFSKMNSEKQKNLQPKKPNQQ